MLRWRVVRYLICVCMFIGIYINTHEQREQYIIKLHENNICLVILSEQPILFK